MTPAELDRLCRSIVINTIDPVTVCDGIGVVHTTDTLDTNSPAVADRLLLEAKFRRRFER